MDTHSSYWSVLYPSFVAHRCVGEWSGTWFPFFPILMAFIIFSVFLTPDICIRVHENTGSGYTRPEIQSREKVTAPLSSLFSRVYYISWAMQEGRLFVLISDELTAGIIFTYQLLALQKDVFEERNKTTVIPTELRTQTMACPEAKSVQTPSINTIFKYF